MTFIKNNYIVNILAIIVFLSNGFYIVWGNFFANICYILIVIYNIYFFIKKNNSNKIFLFFIIYLSLSLWFSLNNQYNAGGFIISILTSLLVLNDKNYYSRLYEQYLNILAILLLISVLCFFIKILNIIPLPYFYLKGPNMNYYCYYIFNIIENTHNTDMLFPRFMAFYDEPGTLGTFMSIILISYKGHIKKNQYRIFLLCGLLSFSFAFYVIYFIYLLFEIFDIKNNIKYSYRVIIILSMLLLLFNIKNIEDDTMFGKLIIQRLEYNERYGFLVNNDRNALEFESQYQNFSNIKNFDNVSLYDYLFGKREKSILSQGGASYKMFIYQNGLIFLILISLWYIYYAKFFIKDNKKYILFLIIYASLIYQRPFIFQWRYFMILIASIYALSINDKYDSKNKNINSSSIV